MEGSRMRRQKVEKMADKPSKPSGLVNKPVPMRLFATWEVEKSSPNCIPRLCTLNLARLAVLKPLENDLASILIAVKMQSSKRVLRSNEIQVPIGGLIETDLDYTFSLQYPHFLKRDGNKLQIMLQRRKKYKNRTILGYKTLAIGQVNMAEVLQKSVDRDLSLYSDPKENTHKVAQLRVLQLASQPVDHEDNGHRKHASSDVDRSPDVDIESDEDEGPDYNDQDQDQDQEFSSNDEMSDSEPMMLEEERHGRPRKTSRSKIRPAAARQRNIKQKFIALLKKFRVTEDALDSEADHDPNDPESNPPELDDLIDELEDLSDSGPELDNLSVMSTPKPRLKPFFQSRGSSHEADGAHRLQDSPKGSEDFTMRRADSELNTAVPKLALELEADNSDSQTWSESSPKPKSPVATPKHKRFERKRSTSYREKKSRKEPHVTERRNSASMADSLDFDSWLGFKSYGLVEISPRKALLDQLSAVLGSSDDKLPDSVFLINTAEWQGQLLVQKLQDKQLRLICTCSNADVKAAISCLVGKLQKFCHSNSKSPSPIKVGVVGGDSYINSVLWPYVEQFSAKSPDWQNYVRFLVIPLGVCSVGKFLASVDPTYASLFMDATWKDTFDKPDGAKLDSQEIYNRISKYLSGASGVQQLPIAEAMINCRGKGGVVHLSDEETFQLFVPFLSEVKIGTADTTSLSMDVEEGSMSPPSQSSSPPAVVPPAVEKAKEGQTPPNSPNMGGLLSPSSSQTGIVQQAQGPLVPLGGEFVELHVDYWTSGSKADGAEKGKKESSKCSLKTSFRSITVSRLPHAGDSSTPSLAMLVVMREKKQKIMRIGKKAKEMESKSQHIEGISRLICSTSKSQNHNLKVMIDGVEWSGVKFFQLTAQWQTSIKSFPVALFACMDTPL